MSNAFVQALLMDDPYSGAAPVATCVPDTNYASGTVLLLHGETVVDSSASPKALTPVAGATVSAAQFKYGTKSLVFNGTTQYHSTPYSADFDFGTGDFTIEVWVYIAGNSPVDTGGVRTATIVATDPRSSGWGLYISGSAAATGTGISLENKLSGTNADVNYTKPITTQVWTNIVVTKRGANVFLFKNGVLIQGARITQAYNAGTNPLYVGANTPGSSYFRPLNGYIDELRITKSTARYLQNFVAPTAQFGDDVAVDASYASVVLLAHFNDANGSTTVTDSSSYARVCTVTNSVANSVKISTAQSKFGGSSLGMNNQTFGAWSVSWASSSDFDISSSDFTIEMWAYEVSGVSSAQSLVCRRPGGLPNGWVFCTSSVRAKINGTWSDTQLAWDAPPQDSWHHYAFVRSGAHLLVFVDGVLVAAKTGVTAIDDQAVRVYLGQGDNASENKFYGFIDDLRWTSNTARYLTSFLPATAAFGDNASDDSSFGSVSLLLHLNGVNNGTAFTDSSGYAHAATRIGTAVTSSTQAKFGATSLSCPAASGVGYPYHSALDLANSIFTVECFAYSIGTTSYGTILDFRGTGAVATSWSLAVDYGTRAVFVYDGPTDNSAPYTADYAIPAAGQWYHLAVVVTGGMMTIFVGGVAMGCASYTVPATHSTGVRVGTNHLGNFSFNGYIDELRITKGVARYSANFTPPAYPSCNGTTDPGAYNTNGNERPTGQALTTAQGTLTVANPWKKLSGQAATASAGSVSVYNPNVAVSLTGKQMFAEAGTTYRPRFPELSNTGQWPYIANTTGPTTTAYAQIVFRPDGNYWVTTNTPGTPTVGNWLYNAYSFYVTANIVHLYRISSVALITNGSFVSQTVAATMASTSTFLVQNTPGATNLYVEFEVTITPTDPSMESIGPYATYVGTHRFRVNLNRA